MLLRAYGIPLIVIGHIRHSSILLTNQGT